MYALTYLGNGGRATFGQGYQTVIPRKGKRCDYVGGESLSLKISITDAAPQQRIAITPHLYISRFGNGPSMLPVCPRHQYRYYRGNRHSCAHNHNHADWLPPYVPIDITCIAAGSRHNSIGTMEGPLTLLCNTVDKTPSPRDWLLLRMDIKLKFCIKHNCREACRAIKGTIFEHIQAPPLLCHTDTLL